MLSSLWLRLFAILVTLTLGFQIVCCTPADPQEDANPSTTSSAQSSTSSREDSSTQSTTSSKNETSSQEETSSQGTTSSQNSSSTQSTTSSQNSSSTQSTTSSQSASSNQGTSSSSHTHSYSSTTVEPTCTTEGYHLQVCACGSQVKTPIAATGHFWGEWTVLAQPTLEYTGLKEHTCAICQATESQELPKLEPAVEAPTWEREVLRLVNVERAKNGLAALTYCDAAQPAADVRAVEIDTVFDHTRPDGSTCFTALDQAGITYFTAGENIAKGHRSPAQVVEAWMNSPGHRANILDPDFTQLVVGVKNYCWVQLFLG